MAPSHNSAAESMLTAHEERLRRLEEEVSMTARDLATQTAYQKSLFKTIEKMEENLSSAFKNNTDHIDSRINDIVDSVDEIKNNLENLKKESSVNSASINLLETKRLEAEKRADKGSDFKVTLISGVILAVVSGVIGYVVSIFG